MLRTVLSVIAGMAAWLVLVTIADRVMRAQWPEYQAVWSAMAFTLPMMIARLAESTAAFIIASWAAARIAPASRLAPWAFGLVMLAIFAPYHLLYIWAKFPPWYHAYFLSSLLLIPPAVGMLTRRTAP
ncbi:MAG TPA: hypothetical protein VHZ29_01455 [Rhizomicrobium sp.]|jgi:hypothetical protein|nr:hypothetical protein [Rhizomicrobium sp.]